MSKQCTRVPLILDFKCKCRVHDIFDDTNSCSASKLTYSYVSKALEATKLSWKRSCKPVSDC